MITSCPACGKSMSVDVLREKKRTIVTISHVNEKCQVIDRLAALERAEAEVFKGLQAIESAPTLGKKKK